jgi:hypothetical protein
MSRGTGYWVLGTGDWGQGDKEIRGQGDKVITQNFLFNSKLKTQKTKLRTSPSPQSQKPGIYLRKM